MNEYEDMKGHRLGQKFILSARLPMSYQGLKNYGYKARARVHRQVFKFTGSHLDCLKNYPQARKHGVDFSCFASDKNMIDFFNQEFCLEEGVWYSLQFFSHGRTRTSIKFSAIMCEIMILNKEKNIYSIRRNNRLKRMWYRKDSYKEKDEDY